ncbi:hypothetical protein JJV70_16680 [Streptomyces sp. JJ66]|uniref:general stress protein n=1 Tax=Streptomyces sp. JJ66 TaxID=2803843 RepID=UPI001C58AB33|nr:general stress protein [Streptomyces sp. JJ66]MBW1603712.1 hypothetical protein [Streptomyces sp. JJ66]
MAEPDIPIGAPSEISMAWNTVASFEAYEEAQAAVDQLSDAKFPVEHLDIIGSDLRLVEHVTGRLTQGSAAAAGAASGAWFGLFIGLLVGLFTTGPAWLGLILGGVLIGAVWGAIFGFVSHAVTGGRRDFSSQRSLVAARYDVVARGGHAEEARTALARARAQAGTDTGNTAY